MIKILHFSPVSKVNEIVNLHLNSLRDLKIPEGLNLTFSFFDDNQDKLSSKLIKTFSNVNLNTKLFSSSELNVNPIQVQNRKERWPKDAYDRITKIKDNVISYFIESDFDFLFLCDSDLVLHPNTIQNLIESKKDFCAQIFWTKFKGSTTYTPNCWYDKPFGFDVNDLKKFRNPGTYRVDFTGACTLLSRGILESGVKFKKIPNQSYLGEDKHFCIRAAVNDYEIFINTKSPCFHIYDESLISKAKIFFDNGYDNSYLNKWLDYKWENEISVLGKSKKQNTLKRIFNKLK